MRKINEIWYVIWFVIGISLFISGCSDKSGIEGKAWFRYASKYDQARKAQNIALANAVSKNEPVKVPWESLAKMSKIKQKFLRAKQPTEKEIISVLRSPNRKFQRVGLIAMYLKPIQTDQLIDVLFEFFQDQDRDFRRYAVYSFLDFTKIPELKKDSLGRRLLETIKNEKTPELFIRKFSLFAKFPSKEAALFLTEQLMKEGKENRVYRSFAFRTLKEMGDSYYDEAAEYVNKHGSPEIKKEFSEREKMKIITEEDMATKKKEY